MKHIDITGKVINSWKILKKAEKTTVKVKYHCECLKCNKNYIVAGTPIRSGRSKQCKSCRDKETGINSRKIKKKSKYVSYEDAGVAYLYKRYIADAKHRSKPRVFNLNIKEFKQLIKDNCFYCGCKPSKTVNWVFNSKKNVCEERRKNSKITYNGIDRVDSEKDYNKDNVVTCCYRCNIAKSNFSLKDFIELIDKIHNNFKGRSLPLL